mmetsp:Transcript_322/g.615  ORF Transcript_322/g.615 Transcript_322/m.615 type:complete len:169 (-) Transcript_322:155-661(-)
MFERCSAFVCASPAVAGCHANISSCTRIGSDERIFGRLRGRKTSSSKVRCALGGHEVASAGTRLIAEATDEIVGASSAGTSVMNQAESALSIFALGLAFYVTATVIVVTVDSVLKRNNMRMSKNQLGTTKALDKLEKTIKALEKAVQKGAGRGKRRKGKASQGFSENQ